MAIPLTSATVAGGPALLTSSGAVAEAWKISVWNAVAEQWPGGALREPCSVDLHFRVANPWYLNTAVANLLKSTIDGLGRAVFAHSPSGQPGPWSTEDWWICELAASKEPVDVEPGVVIKIGPITSEREVASESVAVIGSPAVWIGSGERAWRTAVTDAIRESGIRHLPAQLGVHFDFIVEPKRMRSADIDNLCIPAAQATHDGLFGNYLAGQANRIVAIRAAKSESSVTRPPGLRIAFFDAERYHII